MTTRARIIDRDEGCRIGVHLVFGWSGKRKPLLTSLQAFEDGLADVFAGYLKTPARGRWFAENEDALAYDFTTDGSVADARAQIERLLCLHGGGLHVQWVHIELRSVAGYHVKLEAVTAESTADTAAEYAGQWPRADRTRDEMHATAADDAAVRGTPRKFLRSARAFSNARD